MDSQKLKILLEEVQSGDIDVFEALEKLRSLPFEDIGHTRIDFHRELRKGIPEVVYCQHKTAEQAIAILKRWERPSRSMTGQPWY